MSKESLIWEEIDSRKIAEARVFELHAKYMRSPNGKYEDDFFVIKAPDWCNVIALTEDEKVVMIEQYRHGNNKVCLEFPGGIVEKGETDPSKTALRELEEETGYTVTSIESLGTVDPNPAIQNNLCHLFLAKGAKPLGTVNLEPAESINVRLLPLADIPNEIRNGNISHSLMICSFAKYFLKMTHI